MGFFNRIKGMLAESVRIDFVGGSTEEAEVLQFDTNAKGKIALILQYPQNLGKQVNTGYVFDPEDFKPNPNIINWGTYYGIIICWKDSKGQNDARPKEFESLNLKIKELKELLDLHTDINEEQRRELRLKHTSQARKEEKFEDAESYGAIKELMSTVESENKKSDKNYFSGINE